LSLDVDFPLPNSSPHVLGYVLSFVFPTFPPPPTRLIRRPSLPLEVCVALCCDAVRLCFKLSPRVSSHLRCVLCEDEGLRLRSFFAFAICVLRQYSPRPCRSPPKVPDFFVGARTHRLRPALVGCPPPKNCPHPGHPRSLFPNPPRGRHLSTLARTRPPPKMRYATAPRQRRET